MPAPTKCERESPSASAADDGRACRPASGVGGAAPLRPRPVLPLLGSARGLDSVVVGRRQRVELRERVLVVRVGSASTARRRRGRRLRVAVADLEADDRDVVLAAALVRGVDERLRRRVEVARFCSTIVEDLRRRRPSSVRPSEQSRKRSPGRASTVKVSTSTSGSVPSARVITERCGWTSASSGESSPAADELGDERVVVGQLLELAVADAVGARVADMADRDAVVLDERGGHRRAHARAAASSLAAARRPGGSPPGSARRRAPRRRRPRRASSRAPRPRSARRSRRPGRRPCRRRPRRAAARRRRRPRSAAVAAGSVSRRRARPIAHRS